MKCGEDTRRGVPCQPDDRHVLDSDIDTIPLADILEFCFDEAKELFEGDQVGDVGPMLALVHKVDD